MDYDQQIALALRRQQDAQGRTQYQSPQGRMAGRIYVAPNPLEYMANLLRSAGAGREAELAGQEAQQLQSQKTQAISSALKGFSEMAQGRPADVLPEDQAGPVRSAQAPDMAGAYQQLLNAPTPELRQMGLQGVTQQAQKAAQAAENQRLIAALRNAENPQAAIAAGVPPELVKSYYEAPNLGRAKVKFQDVGGQLVPVDEYGATPQGVSPIAKTGNPFSDLLVAGPGGQLVPNAPLVGAKKSIAKAGASNTTINMPDKKFYEGLGTAVSGQIEKGFEQAQSAVQTLNNANQIAANLDKAIVGPLANQRIGLARVGEMLGVTGADTREVLNNTRGVIQGLARQELAAAGQMKGQGQITESEREILRRAEAGNVQDFTKGELQTFVNAIRRTARSRIQTHQQNVQRLGQDPQAGTVVPFLQLEAPQDVPFSGQQRPTQDVGGGFRIVP